MHVNTKWITSIKSHTSPLSLITKISCWLKCPVLFICFSRDPKTSSTIHIIHHRKSNKKATHTSWYKLANHRYVTLCLYGMCWYCLGRPTFTLITWHTPATGHIALKTTNEVVTTKSRRTTSQPTLMSTTKETTTSYTKEAITTTNETTTSYTSKEYMTTTSSHTLSGSFTTTTGEAI